ncbi:DNA cytosine methyltransferase [Leptolyngbya valderiana BDU 20041]|nr:DNA cytosine methyltransferase [Leptolyngbya valderiana BDU 20041]
MVRPIAIDLFAGAGGMSLGFEQAGFDVRAAVELDPIHCAVHEYNFPETPVLCRNVADVEGDDIRQAARTDEFDAIFGGPPCQGFSLMGKRLLDDPRNNLVFHFVRLVSQLRPKYFVLENVKGMAVGKHKRGVDIVIEKFEACGYTVVTPYRILNASHYGVPQNRERLFLLGYRDDVAPPVYPEPQTRPANGKPTQKLSSLPPSPTVADALRDLPEIEQYDELLKGDSVEAEFGEPSEYGAILRGLAIEPNDYAALRHYDRHRLTGSWRTRHNATSIERFNQTKPGKVEPISRFLRLDPNGICNTLRAGTPSSRGAFTSPRPIHPTFPRCITVREAARLHSYPDWFRFHATKWHGFRQIGNSVPPRLAKAVAEQIVEALGVTPVASDRVLHLIDSPLLTRPMRDAARHYSVSHHVIAPRLLKGRGESEE